MKILNKVIYNKTGSIKRYQKLNKKKGFTLVEALMVLAILGAVIAVVVIRYGSANSKTKAQQMVSDVSTMVADIKNAYSSSANGYNGLTNQVAVQLKLVSPDLPQTNTGTIKNQFPAGTVTIQADSTNDFFTISYTNVPSEVCNIVVTQLGGSGNGFQTIKVGGTTVYDIVNGTSLDPTVVGQSCSSGQQTDIEFSAS